MKIPYHFGIVICISLATISGAVPLETIEEDTNTTYGSQKASKREPGIIEVKNGDKSNLVRNYVKMGAYLGAVYVFLGRNKIFGTNKVTTASLEFTATSLIADPCEIQKISNGVPTDIIISASSMCAAAHGSNSHVAALSTITVADGAAKDANTASQTPETTTVQPSKSRILPIPEATTA